MDGKANATSLRTGKDKLGSSDLHYEAIGQGQAIVFLHPVGLDGSFWRPVALALAERFRSYIIDLPGHGSSPHSERTSIFDYADAVHDLMTTLGLRKAAIVGLSFGGMIAQCLAVAYPDDVGKLILCGCPASFADENRSAIAMRGSRALEGGMANVADETLSRWFSADFIARGLAGAVRDRLLSDDPRAWASAWAAISKLDNSSAVSSLDVSTVCIAGEMDVAVPPAMVEKLAACIPGATFRLLPGASHMMHIESFAVFTASLDELLSIP